MILKYCIFLSLFIKCFICWTQSPTTAQYPTVSQFSYVAQFQTAAQNLVVGQCTWYTKENTNTQGGLEQPLVFTLDQCQAACISNNNCLYGFDWDEKNSRGIKCWLSTMNVQREAAGVLHYFISCPLTTQPPSGPTSAVTFTVPVNCVWNKYPSTQTKGGIPIPIRPPTNDTLDNCKDYCYNNRLLCTMGFDFNSLNPAGQRCYQTTSGTLYSTSPGIDHYEMSGACYGNMMTTYRSSSTSVRYAVPIMGLALLLLLIGKIAP